MALLLRQIRKPRWYPVPDWIPQGTLHADPLADLVTKDNKLSVWRVENDESNLAKILVALAGTREAASNLDYVLFDESIVTQANVSIQQSQGQTIFPEANAAWHRDLTELTARKLVALAEFVMQTGVRRRASKPQVITLLMEAVRQGDIDPNALEDSLRQKIQPLQVPPTP